MAISDRITSIEEHIKESYQELEGIGIDTTKVDKNLENIPKLIDGYWETLPKVTGEGTAITLDNTKEGKMKINLKGNTSQATTILPSGYTQVDYIQSSWTQYIDTGFKPNNNTRTIIDFVDNNSGTGFIFGARTGQSYKAYSFLSQNSVNFRFDNGANQASAGSKLVGYRYKVDYNKNVCNVYEVDTGTTRTNTTTEETFNSGYNMYLFNNNTADKVNQYSNIKLYSCKIYDNGTLVRNFIPCYRNSDNEIGLYDLVNNVFYTNAGIGTFAYGAVATLPNPDYPQDVHVVSGDNSIKVEGKNLFNDYETTSKSADGITISNDENGVKVNGTYTKLYNRDYWITDSDNSVYNNLTLLKANTQYTASVRLFSGTITDTNFRMWISSRTADDNKTFTWNFQQFNYDNNIWKVTFTTGNTDIYASGIRFGLSTTMDITFNNAIFQVQIEKGSTATTYEAYKGASYPINLGDIELCKIGDYQDRIYKDSGKWYLNKQIGKVVLNGSETGWNYQSRGNNVYRGYITVSNGSTSTGREIALSNYFYAKGGFDESSGNIFISSSQVFLYIDIATIDDFKTWLSTHNTTVYYVLATPTYTEITDENLIRQLEALNGARSYTTQTNINQDNNDNASILNASALSE